MKECTFEEMYAGYLEAWEVGVVLRCLSEQGVLDQDRDEVIQDVAMQIRNGHGNGNGVSPATRIFRLTKNRIREFRRREARYRKHIEQIHGDADWARLEKNLVVADASGAIGEQHDVRHALADLTPEHQAVCDLWSEGMSRQEIADSLGCGWLKVERLQRETRRHFVRLGFGTEAVDAFGKGAARAE
jgi:DNA-directed RNA polymerase specialized sigma24 family protein